MHASQELDVRAALFFREAGEQGPPRTRWRFQPDMRAAARCPPAKQAYSRDGRAGGGQRGDLPSAAFGTEPIDTVCDRRPGRAHASSKRDVTWQTRHADDRLGHLRRASGWMDPHGKPLEASQHIVVVARGFGSELDRFDLADQGGENGLAFKSRHCLPDAAVNARS